MVLPIYTYPSIESIKLKVNDKSKGPRQIYGEVMVADWQLYIFRRHGDEAQLVPEDDSNGDGFPLILCGPNHCLPDDEMCHSITVNLYGERSQPLIKGEFVLTDNAWNGRVQVLLQEHIDLPGGAGRLTLTYTRILYSHPAIFQFRLIQAGAEAVIVSGTVRGIHIVPKKPKGGSATYCYCNWLTIFDSREEAVAVPVGEPIPLDRFNFIVPVQAGIEGEEGFYGGSFNIHVDLQLVVHHKVFSIKGETKVVFNELDVRKKLR